MEKFIGVRYIFRSRMKCCEKGVLGGNSCDFCKIKNNKICELPPYIDERSKNALALIQKKEWGT